MKKNSLVFLIFGALLTAIAVVFKVFLGIPVTFLGNFVKDLNLSPAVIMFGGIVMGPWMGALIGALTDIAAFLIRPMGPYVFWFTLTNALIGLIPSLFYRRDDEKMFTVKEKNTVLRAFAVSFTVQTVCSAVMNTILLVNLYGLSLKVALLRAAGSYVSAVLYALIIYYLLDKVPKIAAGLKK